MQKFVRIYKMKIRSGGGPGRENKFWKCISGLGTLNITPHKAIFAAVFFFWTDVKRGLSLRLREEHKRAAFRLVTPCISDELTASILTLEN
jgi:hypothetical protein